MFDSLSSDRGVHILITYNEKTDCFKFKATDGKQNSLEIFDVVQTTVEGFTHCATFKVKPVDPSCEDETCISMSCVKPIVRSEGLTPSLGCFCFLQYSV